MEKANLLQWEGIEDDLDLDLLICIVQYLQYLVTCEQLTCDQNTVRFIQINYFSDSYLRSVCNIKLIKKEKEKKGKEKWLTFFFLTFHQFQCVSYLFTIISFNSPGAERET